MREPVVRTVPIADERVIRPRRIEFVPRACSMCQELRNSDPNIKGASCSYVDQTRGQVRYCGCRYCGNRWKEVGTVE